MPETDEAARKAFRAAGKRLGRELDWLEKVEQGQEGKSKVFSTHVPTRHWVPHADVAPHGSQPVTVEGLRVGSQIRAVREVLRKKDWCAGLGKEDAVDSPIVRFPPPLSVPSFANRSLVQLLFPSHLVNLYRLEEAASPTPAGLALRDITAGVLGPVRPFLLPPLANPFTDFHFLPFLAR